MPLFTSLAFRSGFVWLGYCAKTLLLLLVITMTQGAASAQSSEQKIHERADFVASHGGEDRPERGACERQHEPTIVVNSADRDIHHLSVAHPAWEAVWFLLAISGGISAYPILGAYNVNMFSVLDISTLITTFQPWLAREFRNVYRGVTEHEPEWRLAFIFWAAVQVGFTGAGFWGLSGIWCGMSGYNLMDFFRRNQEIRSRSESLNYLLSFLSTGAAMTVVHQNMALDYTLLHVAAIATGAILYELFYHTGMVCGPAAETAKDMSDLPRER